MNNFKSQKTSLARTTLGLVCAQKSNRLIRYIVFVVMAVGLTACGGGGSSSGGGTAGEPTITFTGSFRTGLYSGGITIVIPPNNSRPIVTLTGVECLTGSFGAGLIHRLNGATRSISGTIPELSVRGDLIMVFPDAGGEGEFTLGLSTAAGCTGASDGTLSVARS